MSIKPAMKVIVTGCNGQVGHELINVAAEFGVQAQGYDRQALDITDAQNVTAIIKAQQPDAVINAAAYTAVDKAETESAQAYAINRDGPANLAKACAEQGIPLLHISTDYVFDGAHSGAYKEDDDLSPLGIYGASKLAGEIAVRQSGVQHIILRTSWVFSAHGNNFVKTMLRLGKEREELGIVADQHGCPTAAREIARALYALLASATDKNDSNAWGTYHYCQPQATTWHSFAKAIFAEAKAQGITLKVDTVKPISTEEYPTPAKRPANSVLACGKIEQQLGRAIRPWSESLAEVIGELDIRH